MDSRHAQAESEEEAREEGSEEGTEVMLTPSQVDRAIREIRDEQAQLETKVVALKDAVVEIQGQIFNHVVSPSESPPSEPQADERKPYMVKVQAPTKGEPKPFKLDDESEPEATPKLTQGERLVKVNRLVDIRCKMVSHGKEIARYKAEEMRLQGELA